MRSFLSADWRYLAMLNYEAPPALLRPFVPAGTVLDSWQGRSYVSVVGFLFRDTRLVGVPVPFHRHFEEINLRTYVVREKGGEVRRGVTFIRELVPRRAIAVLARLAYNEPYDARPMRHVTAPPRSAGELPARVEYGWRERGGEWGRLAMTPASPPSPLVAGSEAEFITEHYWGYTRQRDGGTVEYHVTHPSWTVATAESFELHGDLRALYGPDLAGVLEGAPRSAFLATGSAVKVSFPSRLSMD